MECAGLWSMSALSTMTISSFRLEICTQSGWLKWFKHVRLDERPPTVHSVIAYCSIHTQHRSLFEIDGAGHRIPRVSWMCNIEPESRGCNPWVSDASGAASVKGNHKEDLDSLCRRSGNIDIYIYM